MRHLVGWAIVVSLLLVPSRADAGAVTTAFELDAVVDRFSGTAAVIVSDPASGYRYARNDDVEFYAASLYKLGLMVEAYRQDADGLVSLDRTWLVVGPQDLPPDEPWLASPGTALTLRQALELAVTWSDNSAALALMRVLGTREVAGAFAALGMTRTRLNAVLPADERSADDNVTTAADMERLFRLLLHGDVVSRDASAEMLELLARQHVNDRLPAGLPAGALVAHKTGDLYDQSHDAGLMWTPFGPRIVVVLTAHALHDATVALASDVAAIAYAADLAPADTAWECP